MFKGLFMLMVFTVSSGAMDQCQHTSNWDAFFLDCQIRQNRNSITEQKGILKENVTEYARQFANRFTLIPLSRKQVEEIYYSTVMEHFIKATQNEYDSQQYGEEFLSDLTVKLTLTNNPRAKNALEQDNAFLRFLSQAHSLSTTWTIYDNLVKEREDLMQELSRN